MITPSSTTTTYNEVSPDDVKELGDVKLYGKTYTLSTGNGITQTTLESNLGLDSGSLDSNLNGTKAAQNATEGSAITIELDDIKAGDTLTFSYFWDGGDYMPYDDFAFVSINSNLYSLASVSEVGSWGADKNGIFEYTFQLSDLPEAGENLNLSIGVMDVIDTVVNSSMKINIEYLEFKS